MILNAVVHGNYHYAETWPDMDNLITEVIENSVPERQGDWISPGETAEFSFAHDRHTEDTFDWWPDNYLRVSVNPETGYGALVWFATTDRTVRSGDDIPNHVWVSNNANPPVFDPRVVSDPGYPKFHDRRSTLPVAQIRAALKEFCRIGTGDRPECIQWIIGEMDGTRYAEYRTTA